MSTSTDPVADMLSRIRNAIAVRKGSVTLPHSNLKFRIATVLQDLRFVEGVSVDDTNDFKQLVITINGVSTSPKITEIKRVSTPGQRVYVKASQIPTIKQGRGVVLISTSKGVMTGQDAKAKQLGGEVLVEVY